ncbi:hypothetical protein EVAR_95952_1 [Eumeta japonica]|uniref:Uncharacterized protein n=1 Tax=Eumeta variegata TaxID=151549 RepID=A0A4C1V7J6_EUMVA|nr:hypothetical protein EVAR_95952_1 [Eumeta japonica]
MSLHEKRRQRSERQICKDRTMWKSIVSTCPSGKEALSTSKCSIHCDRRPTSVSTHGRAPAARRQRPRSKYLMKWTSASLNSL